MIQSTQRETLRLIIQTKRRYKKKTRSKNENKAKEEIGEIERMEDGKEDEENQRSPDMKVMMGTAQTQIAVKTPTSLS